MRRRALLAAGGALGVKLAAARAAPTATEAVDLQLVMAVDVSRSIDEAEAELQRGGYRSAMTDPAVLKTIAGGTVGAIAVAYVEWASVDYQQVIVPWTRIANAADAAGWAERLERSPRQSQSWTSLSGALRFSRDVLADCPFEGTRRVIDVSGDGSNNNGPAPEDERDRLAREGVTINGLPIVNNNGRTSYSVPGDELEAYYRNSVIGGTGAFLVVARDFAAFDAALRRKLIQEIA